MRVVRALAAVSLVCASLVMVADDALAASGNVSKTCASLAGLQEDLSAIGSQPDASSFDAGVFTKVGKAFAKAAKKAPKSVKSSFKALAKFYKVVGNADGAADAAAVIGRQAQKYAKAATKFGAFYATECAPTNGSSSSVGGGTGGSLVFGDETVSLDRSLCHLKEQTSAGQKIELTAQGFGTNADGSDVTIDFTRYAQGEQFEGDDVTIDIGSPTSPDLMSYRAALDYGAVDRSGSTLSVSDVEARNLDTGDTASVSFEIDC